MQIKQILLFAVSFVPFLVSTGQEYTFRRYSPIDGLAGETVFNVIEDSYGFLWIGTNNGLSRFDGKTFKNYGYSEGLNDLTIFNVYEDKLHRLWAGTTKGIVELRNGQFVTHYTNDHEISFVYSFRDVDGIGLLSFTGKGVYRYDDSIWTKINVLPEYKKGDCVGIVSADSGLYLNYEHEIFFKKKDLPPVLLLSDTIHKSDLLCNQLSQIRGKLYGAIHNKLYELENGKLHLLINNIPINNYFNFTIDTGNICWVNIVDSGLYKYKLTPEKSQIVSSYKYDSHTNGYPFVDSQGNLWITSYEGLIKALPKIFEDIVIPSKVGAGKRLVIIPGVNNEIIMSDATGLHVLMNGKMRNLKKPVSYKDIKSYYQDHIEGSAKDNKNYTWVITRHRKLLCWNGSELLDFSHLLIPRKTDYIRNITINPINNTVFICDDSTLLCGFEEKFREFRDCKKKSFSKTTTVLFTNKGIGVVNVFLKGIYFITRQNEIIKAPPELDIIDKGSYTYFFSDPDGSVWISNAGKGLVHFDIDENDYHIKLLTVLTTKQGLPSNKISQMGFDAEGNKWVSCINGLSIVKHSTIDSNSWDVYSLGKEQNINLPSPVGLASDKSGNVWIASIDKLIKVDAHKLVLKKITPSVMIEKVLLNMRETNWSKYADSVYGYFGLPVSAVLPYEQNTLGVQFSSASLYSIDYFEYSYLLEPLDKTWSEPSSTNFISFVKLSPGKYIFKVKARGQGTHWSKPAFFGLTILPPFWERWWFRLMFILLAATLIITIYRNRIMKIQKKADIQNQLQELEMKALKSQMNPHFVYNALNSIQSLIADEKKMDAINYVGKFSRLLRQVLEYTDSTVIALDKELQTLRLYIQLESLRLNMNLKYEIISDEEIIAENEKVPPLILQPFVENALWHGLSRKEGEKILNISITQNENCLVCTIEDNGIGRANAQELKKQFSTEIYSSKGIGITVKRLINFNNSAKYPVEYDDLHDGEGNASGTRVIIYIKKQTPKYFDSSSTQ